MVRRIQFRYSLCYNTVWSRNLVDRADSNQINQNLFIKWLRLGISNKWICTNQLSPQSQSNRSLSLCFCLCFVSNFAFNVKVSKWNVLSIEIIGFQRGTAFYDDFNSFNVFFFWTMEIFQTLLNLLQTIYRIIAYSFINTFELIWMRHR